MIRKNNMPNAGKESDLDIRKLKTAAKTNLRTMQKNRNRHPVRQKSRVLKYGATSFSRNIWLSTAATLVMVVTLIILFATIVASVVLTNTANSMREKIDITVFLKPGTDKENLGKLAELLKGDSNVKSVSVSTSEEEMERLIEEKQDSPDVLAALEDEETYKKTLESMQSAIRIKVYNSDDLSGIKNIVNTEILFEQLLDEERVPTYEDTRAKSQIDTITSWARIAKNGGIIFGVVFLTISVLVIFNTVRMSIFSRREEIYMMKLIGANKSFVRGPFIVEAEMCGVISGLIAAILSCAGFNLLSPSLIHWGIDVSSIADIMTSDKMILVFLAFIAVGVIIGLASAHLALLKYMRKA